MRAWVLLLRGVNVGGHGKLPMAELKAILGWLGAEGIGTYIQSGNAVFRGSFDAQNLAGLIEAEVQARRGFRPHCLVLSEEAYRAAVAGYPFDAAWEVPKTGHIWFAASAPTDPDLGRLQAVAKDNERFMLDGATFYLQAPDGIGRSKLAERVEGALGVPATARNLNTATKLVEMLDALA